MATSVAKSESEQAELASQLTVMRGVWTLLFGIFILVWPDLTVRTFAILLALWLLVSGVSSIIGSLMGKAGSFWFLRLLLGVLQIGIGAYLVQRPGITLLTIVALIAIALVVEGVIDIVASLFSGRAFGNILLSLIGGFLAIIIGIFIWRYPVHGTLAFLWMLGIYALISGSFILAAGAKLRRAAS